MYSLWYQLYCIVLYYTLKNNYDTMANNTKRYVSELVWGGAIRTSKKLILINKFKIIIFMRI